MPTASPFSPSTASGGGLVLTGVCGLMPGGGVLGVGRGVACCPPQMLQPPWTPFELGGRAPALRASAYDGGGESSVSSWTTRPPLRDPVSVGAEGTLEKGGKV